MNKRSNCLCGYEGRTDHVNTHKKKCKTFPIIANLEHENVELRKRCLLLESIRNGTQIDLKLENEDLHRKLHIKDKELHQKDEEIQRLLERIKHPRITNNNNINILNICPL